MSDPNLASDVKYNAPYSLKNTALCWIITQTSSYHRLAFKQDDSKLKQKCIALCFNFNLTYYSGMKGKLVFQKLHTTSNQQVILENRIGIEVWKKRAACTHISNLVLLVFRVINNLYRTTMAYRRTTTGPKVKLLLSRILSKFNILTYGLIQTRELYRYIQY